MTKGTDVWISRIMVDSTLIFGFSSDLFLSDKDGALDAMRRSQCGEPLPRDRFPSEMYGKYRDKIEKRKPSIFMANGYWAVSADCAEVLRGVDLGRTALHPVKLFQHDRTTPVEGAYFCLAFGETKDSFVPEMSTGVTRPNEAIERWMMTFGPIKDDEISVTETATTGRDLWIENRLSHAVFLSDRLAEALRRAKLARRFGLRRCKIVALH